MTIGVGVELKENRVSIAVVEKRGDVLRLLSFDTLESDNRLELKEFLQKIWQKKRYPSHVVTLSLPLQHVIMRKFNVNFTDEEQIDQIVYYETENYIHTHQIEDLIVDYKILQTDSDKTRLSVAATPGEIIKKQLSLVEDCGVYPLVLDIDVFGFFYLQQQRNDYSNKNVIFADVHEDYCNLLLITKGKIHDIRPLLMRSSWLAEAIANEMSNTSEININEISYENKNIDIEKYQEKLHKELKNVSLKAESIDKIYFAGDPYIATEMIEAFKKIDIAAVLWTTDCGIEFKNTKDNSAIAAIATGLALRSLGVDEAGFNFRKNDFAYKNSLDLTKLPFLLFLTSLFFLLITGNIYLLTQISTKKQEYNNIVNNTQKIARRNGITIQENNYWNTIPQTRKVMEEIIEKQNRLPQIYQADVLWHQVAEAINNIRRKYYIVVDAVSINEREIIITGRTNDDVCLDSLKNYLKTKDWIAEEGQKVLEAIPLRNPKNPELHIGYRYYVKLREQ